MYNENQMKKLGLSNPNSAAMRFVPKQPTIFHGTEDVAAEKRFNGRKLSELLHQIEDMSDEIVKYLDLVFSDFETMYAILKLGRTPELL